MNPFTVANCLRWTLLAAAPVLLYFEVTTYVLTDISPIPGLWLFSAALYLLSWFIAVPAMLLVRPLAVAAQRWLVVSHAVAIVVWFGQATAIPDLNTWWTLGIVYLAYSLSALVCHTELVKDCPLTKEPAGVLGCWVAGMVTGVLLEYLAAKVWPPILAETLIVTCILRPRLPFRTLFGCKAPADDARRWRRYAFDVLVALAPAMVAFVALRMSGEWARPAHEDGWLPPLVFATLFGVCFLLSARPLRFGLALGALLLVSQRYSESRPYTYADRSYFGVADDTKTP